MTLQTAEASDWEAMFGIPEPADWFGLVSRRGVLIEGLGAIYRDAQGRCWLTFARAPGVGRTRLIIEGGRTILAMARACGFAVHAIAQPQYPVEETVPLMRRLGFAPTGEIMGGATVWRTL